MLTGCYRVPWRFWMVQMTISCLNMTSHFQLTIANWGANCLPQKMKDPPKVFKDAVDRWFQGALIFLNGSNAIPYCCLALIWHPNLSWQLQTWAEAVPPPMLDDGSFKYLWRCRLCSQWAITGRHGGSEWFSWHTLTLSCLNMTSYSQLTIANSPRMLCTSNRWWILQMYAKMQLTGCSRVLWHLWMVQMTPLNIAMP